MGVDEYTLSTSPEHLTSATPQQTNHRNSTAAQQQAGALSCPQVGPGQYPRYTRTRKERLWVALTRAQQLRKECAYSALLRSWQRFPQRTRCEQRVKLFLGQQCNVDPSVLVCHRVLLAVMFFVGDRSGGTARIRASPSCWVDSWSHAQHVKIQTNTVCLGGGASRAARKGATIGLEG